MSVSILLFNFFDNATRHKLVKLTRDILPTPLPNFTGCQEMQIWPVACDALSFKTEKHIGNLTLPPGATIIDLRSDSKHFDHTSPNFYGSQKHAKFVLIWAFKVLDFRNKLT